MRSKITFLRHTREGGYPDSFDRFNPCRWIPAYAGMTDGKLLLSTSLFSRYAPTVPVAGGVS
jgi:hypothetical protein